MKKSGILLAILFLGLAIFTPACTPSEGEGGEKKVEQTTPPKPEVNKVDKTGKEYTSAYICPMYCEGSGSAEMGKCPACNMDYVENDKPADAHEEDGSAGGDHSDHG